MIHRDISIGNVLLHRKADGSACGLLIDYDYAETLNPTLHANENPSDGFALSTNEESNAVPSAKEGPNDEFASVNVDGDSVSSAEEDPNDDFIHAINDDANALVEKRVWTVSFIKSIARFFVL